MKKAELKKMMERYLIFESDLDSIFEFVVDLLDARADETEKKYPYAFNTINRLRGAAYDVYDLIDFIDEIMTKEND